MASPCPRSPKVEAWSQSRFAPSLDPTQFNLNSSSSQVPLSPIQSPSHSRSTTTTDQDGNQHQQLATTTTTTLPEIESISLSNTSTTTTTTRNSERNDSILQSQSRLEEADSISLQDLRSLYSRPTLGPGLITETLMTTPPPNNSNKSNHRLAFGFGTPQTPTPSTSTSPNSESSPSININKLKTPPSVQTSRFGYGGHNRIASLSSNPSNSPLNPSTTTNTGFRNRTTSNSSNGNLNSGVYSPTPNTNTKRRSYVHAAQMERNYPPVRVLPLEEKRRILVTGG